ncbi:hypothetical protein [Aureivirga marina]|uniref:hypothetical protein n=1 Tax=Aureivirga marina TaxID=1182451 RepID=UPI0018C9D896|nr:hypothetical protein [Aureivirga marina]
MKKESKNQKRQKELNFVEKIIKNSVLISDKEMIKENIKHELGMKILSNKKS